MYYYFFYVHLFKIRKVERKVAGQVHRTSGDTRKNYIWCKKHLNMKLVGQNEDLIAQT